jgi:hypothetical protein
VLKLAVFEEFDIKNRMENIKLLKNTIFIIKNVVPYFSKILRLLDYPRWIRDKPEEVQLELQYRYLLIFSIICTSLYQKKCTNLLISFNIYLFNGGATKRVINIYN